MSDLTERYVAATLRSIPDKQRTDIEAELRASIGDAIEARSDLGASADAVEEAVLADLGDPDRLAAGYTGQPAHLIGPELFFDYKRLLWVLLATVVPVTAIVIGVIKLASGDGVGSAIGGAVTMALTLVVHIGFWTTLVFAIVERTNPKATGQWTPATLPPLTPTRASISLGDTIGAVVFLVIAIVGLVLSRDVFGATSAQGEMVPIFEPSMWDFWLPALTGVLIVELVFEFVKYRMGSWNMTLAVVNLAINVAFAVPAVYLLATEQLLNPEFFEALGGSADWVGPASTVTVAIVIMAAGWDVFDGFRKAIPFSRGNPGVSAGNVAPKD